MSLRSYRTFQALILGGLGIYLFSKVVDGRILFYINQRFVILVLLAALFFVFLAQLALRERPIPGDDEMDPQDEESSGRGWAIWLLALPLLIGLLAPERPLGANALEMRGVNLSGGRPVQSVIDEPLQIPSTQRSVLDWIRLAQVTQDLESLSDQPADLTGFVYHDARLPEDQFLVVRFTIACCVADAFASGLVVQWPDAGSLPDNRWVRIQGPVRVAEVDGRRLLMITAESIAFVPEPEQPYLFQ